MKKNKTYNEGVEYFDYFEKSINPILKELKHAIMRERPEDVETFSLEWLLKLRNGEIKNRSHPDAGKKASGPLLNLKNKSKPGKLQKTENTENSISSDDDNESVLSESEFKKMKERRQKKNQRKGVSAEAYGRFNKKEDFKPIVVEKDSKQVERIHERINENLLFKNLNEEDKKVIVDAMEEVKAKPGDYVIKQGDSGNEFYIVDEGQLDCFKEFKGKKPKYLKTYFQGEGFGELSLLYNAPRAASIVAKTKSILYKLDRGTFNHIILDSTIKKRKRYEDLIKKIKLLDTLDPYEQQLLIDAFQEARFKEGQYVIKEGDDGDTFYFIEKGQAVALKKNKKTGKNDQVYRYKRGGYFGEIALLKEVKRQASIKAVTDLVLMSIDKKSFNRILGPLDLLLKRNIKRYDKFVRGEKVGEDSDKKSQSDGNDASDKNVTESSEDDGESAF